jgi:hypothetical protein
VIRTISWTPQERSCPKLVELEKLLDDCRENNAKVIVFSEWERMLELVRELCRKWRWASLGTRVVSLRKEAGEINAFKSDPECRVFLSTDSGATGLNLQVASVVINCDLPWNPARLEQRIARSWRKHQTLPVTVVNLISENTLEHRMLDTLATKQTVAESVLDAPGRVTAMKIRSGRQSFIERLQQLVASKKLASEAAPRPPRVADPALAFARAARETINGALVRCEERYPISSPESVLLVVVDKDAASWRERLATLHAEVFRSNTDPLAPCKLEVIDRATDEALQRLIAAGLITKADRAIRPLDDAQGAQGSIALTAEEQTQVTAHRANAERKLKAARLLADAALSEEARAALLEGATYLARAFAVRGRLTLPANLDDALRPPLLMGWAGGAEP